VTRNGETVHLTPIEYKLLCHFIAHPGRVLTHRQILRAVWGPGQSAQGHYLRVYVGRLRHKFEADPARPVYLHTETGVGYRFAP
jgi:two-component system, OmpR family, KDP operon response regulator KdpE